jgi:hypothetical protein
MVAAVYGRMAVQAGTVIGPVVQDPVYGLSRLIGSPRSKFARMPDVGVTPLAKIRHFGFQEGGSGRTVGGMTGQTVFNNGRVVPEVRSPLVSMALKTLEVGILGIHQFIRYGSMGVVTV